MRAAIESGQLWRKQLLGSPLWGSRPLAAPESIVRGQKWLLTTKLLNISGKFCEFDLVPVSFVIGSRYSSIGFMVRYEALQNILLNLVVRVKVIEFGGSIPLTNFFE